jgi:hypothetical protein
MEKLAVLAGNAPIPVALGIHLVQQTPKLRRVAFDGPLGAFRRSGKGRWNLRGQRKETESLSGNLEELSTSELLPGSHGLSSCLIQGYFTRSLNDAQLPNPAASAISPGIIYLTHHGISIYVPLQRNELKFYHSVAHHGNPE